jgi:hypothetical protein
MKWVESPNRKVENPGMRSVRREDNRVRQEQVAA